MPHRRSKEAHERRKIKYHRYIEEFSISYPLEREPQEFSEQHKATRRLQEDQLSSYLTHERKDFLRNASKGCQICGWCEYPEALVIHHLDINRENNHYNNLMVLCRNCHYLVHKGLKEVPSTGA